MPSFYSTTSINNSRRLLCFWSFFESLSLFFSYYRVIFETFCFTKVVFGCRVVSDYQQLDTARTRSKLKCCSQDYYTSSGISEIILSIMLLKLSVGNVAT